MTTCRDCTTTAPASDVGPVDRQRLRALGRLVGMGSVWCPRCRPVGWARDNNKGERR